MSPSLLAAALVLAAGALTGLLVGAAPTPAPSLALSVPTAPVASGHTVTLTARTPALRAHGAPQLTWDLDADGQFDDAAGRVVTRTFAGAGAHRVQAKAVWLDGPLPIARTVVATVRLTAA
jgi:hypothetical protein